MAKKVQDVLISLSAVGLLVMLVVSAVAIAGKLVLTKNPTILSEEYAYVEIVVQPGDTLWSIAKAQVPGSDPRDVVGTIRDLNQLESADIFPGQTLTVLVKQSFQPLQLAEGRSSTF